MSIKRLLCKFFGLTALIEHQDIMHVMITPKCCGYHMQFCATGEEDGGAQNMRSLTLVCIKCKRRQHLMVWLNDFVSIWESCK